MLSIYRQVVFIFSFLAPVQGVVPGKNDCWEFPYMLSGFFILPLRRVCLLPCSGASLGEGAHLYDEDERYAASFRAHLIKKFRNVQEKVQECSFQTLKMLSITFVLTFGRSVPRLGTDIPSLGTRIRRLGTDFSSSIERVSSFVRAHHPPEGVDEEQFLGGVLMEAELPVPVSVPIRFS